MSRRSSDAVRLAVVPVLAAAFLAGCGEEEETAYCVDAQDTIVDNSFCDNDFADGVDNYFWYFGGAAVGGKALKKGLKLAGGTKIVTSNKAALAQRGGFGSASSSSDGVGKTYSSGGGYFSGGG